MHGEDDPLVQAPHRPGLAAGHRGGELAVHVAHHTDAPVRGGRRPGAAGVGPLLHRRYSVNIANTQMTPETLMDRVADQLNQASPEMATFRKTRGAEGGLRAGDELVVRMPGPWDGPVRVGHRDTTSFRLDTLAGHLEAGHIEFRASQAGE